MESVTGQNNEINEDEMTTTDNLSNSDISVEKASSDEIHNDNAKKHENEPTNDISGRCTRISKFVLFGINSVLMLILTLRYFSVIGLAAFGIASALVFLILYNSHKIVPAIVDIPVIMLFDVFIYIAVLWDEVLDNLAIENLELFYYETSSSFWVMAVIALILGAIGLGKRERVWLTGASGGTLCFLFIVVVEKAGFLHNPYVVNGLKIGVVLFTIIWVLILYLIGRYVPARAKGTVWIGICLTVLFFFFVVVDSDFWILVYYLYKSGFFYEIIIDFPWWFVVMSCDVLLGLAIALFMFNRGFYKGLCLDCFGLIIAFESILTTKLLFSFYFSYNFIILIVVLIGTLHCIKNTYDGKRTIGFNAVAYLFLQYCVAFILILFLKNGWWINAILGVVFFIVLFSERERRNRMHETKAFMHWTIVLTGIVSQGMALSWYIFFSSDIMLLLFVVYIVSLATVFIINMRAPGMRVAPYFLSKVVCFLVALSCIAVISKRPVSIDYRIYELTDNYEINVTYRGKLDKAVEAEYYYIDSLGRRIDESRHFKGNSYIIPIKGEILIIKVNVDGGITATKTIWYPYDMKKLLDEIFMVSY